MLTSSARSRRNCGKPKRFDSSDSEEDSNSKSVTKKSAKRKVNFSVDTDEEMNVQASKKPRVYAFKSPSTLAAANIKKSSVILERNVIVKGHSINDDSPTMIENHEEDKNGDDSGEDDTSMESMLSEYRKMCEKREEHSAQQNLANGSLKSDVDEDKLECGECLQYKMELDSLEEMLRSKDTEMEQVVKNLTESKAGGQKLASSLSESIEKRIEYHKLYLQLDKKVKSLEATTKKWESLYYAEASSSKDLSLRCEALELKLKMEQKRNKRSAGMVEIPADKLKQLHDLKNYHTKNCTKLTGQVGMLQKENTSTVKQIEKIEADYKNKFMRMKKHYQMLLDNYIQKDSKFSKRKSVLESKMALYKDVGSREQIIRDASKYLNGNQMAFLEGQLSTESTLFGKSNAMPVSYKELLLSLYQKSVITYKTLRSYNFNLPPVLSMQQVSQSEISDANPLQYELFTEKSVAVPAERRTLRVLNSEEEDEEISDVIDNTEAADKRGIVLTDEEAEDGVDGDSGDVETNETPCEEEEEEGGADYLSDDEPTIPKTAEDEEIEGTEGIQIQVHAEQAIMPEHLNANQFVSTAEDGRFESMDLQQSVIEESTMIQGINEHHQVVESVSVPTLQTSHLHEVMGDNMVVSEEHLVAHEGEHIIVSEAAEIEASGVMEHSGLVTAPTVVDGTTSETERGPDMPLL